MCIPERDRSCTIGKSRPVEMASVEFVLLANSCGYFRKFLSEDTCYETYSYIIVRNVEIVATHFSSGV
ncbi:hypothetical protein Trydic_g23754 [Trypoxylus dichotomus]